MIFTPDEGNAFIIYDASNEYVETILAETDYDRNIFMMNSCKHGEIITEKTDDDLNCYLQFLSK